MTIIELIQESHDRAKRKGFYEQEPSIDRSLCRLHSEVTEAWEALRDGNMLTTIREDGKPEGFASELADVAIVLFDLCGYLNIDLAREIRLKSDFNERREPRHGRRNF